MARKYSFLRVGTPEYAIRMAEHAISSEKAGDRVRRDSFSQKAFGCRKVTVGNVEVETWWDTATRSYVTYTKDGIEHRLDVAASFEPRTGARILCPGRGPASDHPVMRRQRRVEDRRDIG